MKKLIGVTICGFIISVVGCGGGDIKDTTPKSTTVDPRLKQANASGGASSNAKGALEGK